LNGPHLRCGNTVRRAPQYELRAAGVPPQQEKRGAQRGGHAVLPGLISSGVPQGATIVREWGGVWSEAVLASSGIVVSGRRSRT